MNTKINLNPGDVIEMPGSPENDMRRPGRGIKERYRVLQIYPHFALCKKARGGFRECFTWHQLRMAAKL